MYIVNMYSKSKALDISFFGLKPMLYGHFHLAIFAKNEGVKA